MSHIVVIVIVVVAIVSNVAVALLSSLIASRCIFRILITESRKPNSAASFERRNACEIEGTGSALRVCLGCGGRFRALYNANLL